MKKFVSFILLVVFLLTMTTSCTTTTESKKTDTKTNAEPKIFTYAMSKEPFSLDSQKCNDEFSGEVLYELFEGLVRNNDGKTIPGAAEKWETSSDGLTYTFHLRDSVWSDGQPVTAKDFEYSFQRYFSPKTAAAFADSYYYIKNSEAINKGKITDITQLGVKAIDDKTFEIKLEYPVAAFIAELGSNQYFYPTRKDYVEKYGEQYAADETKIMTNGPFKLEKWEHESKIEMVKNDKFWDAKAVKLDKITRLVVADGNTIMSMYDSGNLDFMDGIPKIQMSKYPDAKTFAGGSMQMIQFNVKGSTKESGKVMSNKNFRKALSYAINREAVVAAVSSPGTLPADRFVDPSIMGIKDTYVNEFKYTGVPSKGDPEKAKQYLDAALKELGITADKLPKLTYLCMESKTHKLYAEALQAAWSSVLGLKNIEIKIAPPPVAIQNCMDRKYDIYLQGLSTGVDPDNIIKSWVAGGGINWTGWEDKEYSDMIKAEKMMVDPNERMGKVFEAEKYLLDNGPMEPLWFPGAAYVCKDYVSGLVKHPTGGLQLIYTDVNK